MSRGSREEGEEGKRGRIREKGKRKDGGRGQDEANV